MYYKNRECTLSQKKYFIYTIKEDLDVALRD